MVDEYTFAQYTDPAYAADVLDGHWDNFYSQGDLQDLADSGITHVRVPVNYWWDTILLCNLVFHT